MLTMKLYCERMDQAVPKSSHTEESDAALLERYATQRDRDAIARLLERHADAAYRLALWSSENAATAEDIVQAAFLDILSSPNPKVSNVRGWIMRIVVTTARDKQRQEQRRQARENAVADRTSTVKSDDSGKQELIEAALKQARALPQHYRVPILLHYMESLSIAEVSAALDVPEKTIRSQISRGLEQIRSALAGAGFTCSAAALPDMLSHAPLSVAPAAVTTSIKTMAASGAVMNAAALGTKPVAAAFAVKAAIVTVVMVACTAAYVANRNAGPSLAMSADGSAPVVTSEPAETQPKVELDSALAEQLERKISVNYQRFMLKEVLDDLNERVGLQWAIPETIFRAPLLSFEKKEARVKDVLQEIEARYGMKVEFAGRTVLFWKECTEAELRKMQTGFQSTEPRLRCEAVCEMGSKADKRVLQMLLKALFDQDADVRKWAAFSCYTFRKSLPLVVPAHEREQLVANLLKDLPPSGEYRRALIAVLGWTMDARAEKHVIDALIGTDVAARQAAAEVIRHYRSPEAIKAALLALEGPDHEVTYPLALSLAQGAAVELAEPLIAMMKRTATFTQAPAIAALPADVLLPQIEEMLKGTNTVARENCPQVLSLVRGEGQERAWKLLVGLLKDDAPRMRRLAVNWIVAFENNEAADVLIKHYDNESDAWTRQCILTALARSRTQKAADFVMARFPEFELAPDNYEVIRAIGSTRDPRAEEILLKIMESGPQTLKQFAIQGLGDTRSDKALQQLRAAATSPDDYVRWNATMFLYKLGDPAALAPALKFLDQPPVPWMSENVAPALRQRLYLTNLSERERIVKALEDFEKSKVAPKPAAEPAGDF